MRLNCYPHPTEGLWISESNLASALKEGEADLCWHISPEKRHWRAQEKQTKVAMKAAFERLIWHNGLRIKKAIARELKWLGISLLWCWMPLRDWLEVRIGTPGKL